MKKIIKFNSSTFYSLKKLINNIFLIWMLLILIGAVKSTNLDLTVISHKLFAIIILIILLSVYMIKKHDCYFNSKIKSILLNHKFLLFFIFSMLLLIGQILFLMNTYTPIGFDVGGVVNAVISKKPSTSYFSYNSNNLPLFFLERLWGSLFGANWLSFSIMSLISCDLAFAILIVTARYIGKEYMYTTWFLSNLLLVCFPYIIVPYTDTFVMPLVNLSFLGYVIIKKTTTFHIKLFGALLLGTFGMLAYLMKPSSIIFIISIGIIELFYIMLKNSHASLFHISTILLITIAPAVVLKYNYNSYVQQQEYVQINTSMEKPPELFIAMGMTNDGGYNSQITDGINALSTQRAKKSMAIKYIKKTLHNYGPVGYAQFLLKKNINNTSSGTFGWLHEGYFITKPAQNKFQSFIYPNGTHLLDYFFISQLVYIFLILILVLGYKSPSKLTHIILSLKLSIIGSLVYLLIFEGGRSRYLIQFLPQMVLLAGISLSLYLSDKFNLYIIKK